MLNDVVIVCAVRTPIGSFQGSLGQRSATELGSAVISEVLRRADLTGSEVDEVIFGNVLSAGLGQAPTRQAALGAGLPQTVKCLTVNKVCGSGLKAVMLAAQAVQLGEAEIVVAGGMESMSNAPYLLPKARGGYRMGHGTIVDSLIKDGLWDVYNDFHMGSAAELCARKFQISRHEQDEFAAQSYRRAQLAQQRGRFAREIVPVVRSSKNREIQVVDKDEEIGKFDFEKLKLLRPAFSEEGTVTAGNASSISDGAAAVVVMSSRKASEFGISPMVRIKGWVSVAREPEWFTIAPAQAVRSLLKRCDDQLGGVDLYEINEAFAAASIAVNRELGLDGENVNISGGAIALGHPIGASGARILTTLIYDLRDLSKRQGIATLCIGGGEAVAMMIENTAGQN
jgi:acetyl-CoA C-acetyltransferase